MIKSEMKQALSNKISEIPQKDMELAFNCILRQMENALAKGERIEIRGFGSFELRHRPPRLARNPQTGESFQIKAKAAVHFKPGKELKKRVNQGTKHELERMDRQADIGLVQH